MLNPSDAKQTLSLKVNGTTLAKEGQLWQLAPASLNAINTVGKKPEVEIQSTDHVAVPETVEVAPFSINIYSYAVK